MRIARIAPLVEGDGEVKAVPVLLRRIIQAIDFTVSPMVPPGFRHPSGSMQRSGGLERAISAVAEIYPGYAILVLMDSDDDCPKALSLELTNRAKNARPDLQISVVLAHREYESWFLAAAESLAGKHKFSQNIAFSGDPEKLRDAKGWLSSYLPSSTRYSPTQDQAAVSSLFDLDLAKSRSRSFRKLWKEVEVLLQTLLPDEVN